MSKIMQCKAKTRNGSRCPNPAGESGFCFTHDPDRAAERAAARKLGGFNRRTAARISGDEPIKIESLADVLKLINAVIADCWQLDNSPARGRVLLSCADTAIKALQIGELEDRVKALEVAMQQRGNNGN